MPVGANPFVSSLGYLAGLFLAAASGPVAIAIQWMRSPGVYVNGEVTSRQWMAAPGVYVN